jgi:hypothetical protein
MVIRPPLKLSAATMQHRSLCSITYANAVEQFVLQNGWIIWAEVENCLEERIVAKRIQ